jgi:hypothetical protein
LQVTAGIGVHRLQACLDVARRSGAGFDLPEHEPQLAVSAQPAGRNSLGHQSFQSGAFGQNQLMIGDKSGCDTTAFTGAPL